MTTSRPYELQVVDFSVNYVQLGICGTGCDQSSNYTRADWNQATDRICTSMIVPVEAQATADSGGEAAWSDNVDVFLYFPDGATYGTYPAFGFYGFTSDWPAAWPWYSLYHGSGAYISCRYSNGLAR